LTGRSQAERGAADDGAGSDALSDGSGSDAGDIADINADDI